LQEEPCRNSSRDLLMLKVSHPRGASQRRLPDGEALCAASPCARHVTPAAALPHGPQGVHVRDVSYRSRAYSPWSCSPSPHHGADAPFEASLWPLPCPLGHAAQRGPTGGGPFLRPSGGDVWKCRSPPARTCPDARPNRGFVAFSQVLSNATAARWSCPPAYGGFLLPPPPPSFSWPLCVSPRPQSAADGACCVRRGGRNQVPCQRTSLCLPRLSLLRAVCLSLSFCLAGADPAKCVCREMMDHDAPAEMAVCGLRRDTGGGRGVV
jgi:hypothetical protein